MVSRPTAYTYYCSTFGAIRLPCIPFLHLVKNKIPFISFILLFLISSIGPWRFSEITRYTMHKRIDTLIQNNKLGTNNLLTFDSLETQCTQLDSIDATRLQDNLLYLTENYGAKDIQVWFTDSVSSMQFSKLTQGITSALNRSQENHRIYFPTTNRTPTKAKT